MAGHLPLIDTLRSQYEHRETHLDEARLGDDGSNDPVRNADAEQELLEHRLIRRAEGAVGRDSGRVRVGATSEANRERAAMQAYSSIEL